MFLFINNPIGDALNNTEWAFPMLECIHIIAFCFSIGTIALVDLRLMGLAFNRQSPAHMLRDTTWWTLPGLAVVVFSGAGIFMSDPIMYLHNNSFLFKMGALLIAILYNYTIHSKVASAEPPSSSGKLVGALSILLWVSVVAGGLFI